MHRPLLHTRDIFIPACQIYKRAFSSALVHTWGLDENPSISLAQPAELTGKSQAFIYGHMTCLRKWGALRWRPSGIGTLIVSFPPETEAVASAPAGKAILDSRNLEKPDPSLSADPILDSEDLRGEGKIQDSGNLEKPDPSFSADPNQDPEDLRREGEKQDSRNLEKPDHSPIPEGLGEASGFRGVELPGSLPGGRNRLTGKEAPRLANPGGRLRSACTSS